MKDPEKLSPGAREIADKLGLNGDVAEYIQKHPESIGSLNEYIEWREHEKVAVSQTAAVPSIKHPLVDALKKRVSAVPM